MPEADSEAEKSRLSEPTASARALDFTDVFVSPELKELKGAKAEDAQAAEAGGALGRVDSSLPGAGKSW